METVHTYKREKPATKRLSRLRPIYKDRHLYLMLLPGLLFFVVFKYIPLYGIVIAFQDYDIFRGIRESEWVGWATFKEVFAYSDFWVILGNTLQISVYKILFGFPAPIVVALLLNELGNRYFKKYVQTILYLPHFISWVVISGIVLTIMSPTNGVLSILYEWFGMEPKNLLADPTAFRIILVASDIWKDLGWGTIIYLAALTQVDPSLYEAATVDGAGKWKQTWHITLPGIRNVIVLLLILRIGLLMNAGFEQILVMQNSAVLEVSEILDTFVFKFGLQQGNYSFATAVGLFNSAIALVLILGAQWISKKFGEEGLM
ncbi:ABC transporter permease subunit [Cohnella ginsengisoli]|uniref:ABC transporter permease subunit n=1 Tax=Cohnella ginsengisoli TaxID=425004 RepID=A0A9X4QMH8_9BACL|nr:ABC transporter permease subunit [Cohnella ginsengisoli]MDG0791255.1 ABC transporter permease subunit [Cohnella ginsengisoli]